MYFLSDVPRRQNETVSAAADRPARRSASRPPVMYTDVDGQCDKLWPMTVTSLGYHTDRPPKLTAPETISRSRDMVGVHQNLNVSRDLPTPHSGIFCHPWASTCYRQPTYRIWSLYLYSLWRYERRYEMSKIEWFWVVRVIKYHWKSHHSIEYMRSKETMALSFTISEIQRDVSRKSPIWIYPTSIWRRGDPVGITPKFLASEN